MPSPSSSSPSPRPVFDTTDPPEPNAAGLLRAAARVLALGQADAIANATDYLNLVADLASGVVH